MGTTVKFVVTSFLCGLILLFTFSATAQETTPEPRFVTDDEINAIAGRMYCPVCEYVPLDTCGEPACIVWKNEIRTQLEAGRTEDEIISNFVARYGDRVVGVPQNTGLRILSVAAPFLIAIAAVIVGIITFSRWRGQIQMPASTTPMEHESIESDDYRARLEQDLKN